MATLERDETQGQNFLAQLSTLHPENIVYVDESGMDSRDEYDYGWSLKGQRFHALKSGHRLGRVNIIESLLNQGDIEQKPQNAYYTSLGKNRKKFFPKGVDKPVEVRYIGKCAWETKETRARPNLEKRIRLKVELTKS